MAATSVSREKLSSSTKTTNKRSFDYKMCKKVAELTQVVHMLFTKSHEKDIELDLTRKAYEEEIAHVISDAKSRIEKVEQSLASERRRTEMKCSQITRQHDQQLKSCISEYTTKISSLDEEISSLTSKIVDLKQELETINSIGNITGPNVVPAPVVHNNEPNREEPLSTNVSGEDSKGEQCGRRKSDSKSNEEYLTQITELQKISREKDLEIQDLQQLKLKAEEENIKTRDKLAEVELKKQELIKQSVESEKIRARQTDRIKALEKELKSQRKDLEKLQLRTWSRQSSSPALSAETTGTPKNNETSYELERLKKEVERYRLELSNREGNFNRMFTSTNPVRVDSSLRGLSLGMARQKTDIPSPTFKPLNPVAGMNRSELRKPKLIDKRLPLLSMEGKSKTSLNLNGQHGAATGGKPIVRRTDVFQQAF